jgi:hypothetical protein
MKPLKKILIAIIILIGFSSLNIFGQILKVGENDLNFGIGFGSPWIKSGYHSLLPPVSVSLDHGLRDDWGKGIFTLGGFFGVSRYAEESEWYDTTSSKINDFGYKYTSTIFAARATYHYELSKGLDTYVGLMGGVRINTSGHYGTWPNYTDNIEKDANLNLVGRFFIGAKYNFTEKFSCFGELGYGISYVTLGVSFRI